MITTLFNFNNEIRMTTFLIINKCDIKKNKRLDYLFIGVIGTIDKVFRLLAL